MDEMVSERINQVTEMIRELEGQIREATSSGQPIQGANMQKAINDLFSAMGALYFTYMPPYIAAQVLQPATVGGQTGTQTTGYCPNCNYKLTISLI